MLQVENTLFTIVMLLYFASMILYFAYVAVKREGDFSRLVVGIVAKL